MCVIEVVGVDSVQQRNEIIELNCDAQATVVEEMKSSESGQNIDVIENTATNTDITLTCSSFEIVKGTSNTVTDENCTRSEHNNIPINPPDEVSSSHTRLSNPGFDSTIMLTNDDMVPPNAEVDPSMLPDNAEPNNSLIDNSTENNEPMNASNSQLDSEILYNEQVVLSDEVLSSSLLPAENSKLINPEIESLEQTSASTEKKSDPDVCNEQDQLNSPTHAQEQIGQSEHPVDCSTVPEKANQPPDLEMDSSELLVNQIEELYSKSLLIQDTTVPTKHPLHNSTPLVAAVEKEKKKHSKLKGMILIFYKCCLFIFLYQYFKMLQKTGV